MLLKLTTFCFRFKTGKESSPSASTLALTYEALLSEFKEKIVTRAEKALKLWKSYKMKNFSDLFNLMQLESKRKTLFDLDHFVHTLASYEEYSFAERMEQKFIDLEMKALTERFQNLSREERVLKLAENKLPSIDDTHQIGDLSPHDL